MDELNTPPVFTPAQEERIRQLIREVILQDVVERILSHSAIANPRAPSSAPPTTKSPSQLQPLSPAIVSE